MSSGVLSVCLVTFEFPPGPHGGTGSSVYDLAAGLCDAGHHVHVVVARRPGQDEGFDVTRYGEGENFSVERVVLDSPPRLGWKLGQWWQRMKVLRTVLAAHRTQRFDLVEVHDCWGLMPLGTLGLIPMVVRLQGTDFLYDTDAGTQFGEATTYAMERRTLQRASHWIGISEFVIRRSQELFDLKRPVSLIYHSVDPELFCPGVDGVGDEILFVNTLHPRKGFEELLVAFEALAADFPEVRLSVVGRDICRVEGSESWSDRLLRTCLSESSRKRVQMRGQLPRDPDVIHCLQRARVCVYPSKLETFGIATVESMAVGRPTLSSRNGPGPELIEDGVHGWLCDPRDPKDIEKKLRLILERRDRSEAVGLAGRSRVLERFAKPDWIGKNEDCFRRICGEKHSRD